jgi:hypothetical protein
MPNYPPRFVEASAAAVGYSSKMVNLNLPANSPLQSCTFGTRKGMIFDFQNVLFIGDGRVFFRFTLLTLRPPKILSRKNHPGRGGVPAHPARGTQPRPGRNLCSNRIPKHFPTPSGAA